MRSWECELNGYGGIRPKALIFDFDGLIVDTETPLFTSWQTIFRDHEQELSLETYLICVGGTVQQFDPLDHLEYLLGEPVDRIAIERDHRRRVENALSAADTLPGVRERVDEARIAGLGLAIASSSSSRWIDHWLGRLEMVEHFPVTRTRDKVKAAKPDPELFITAAEHLGVSPREAVVFEDSHNGLKAARAAGMRCVVVPNGITRGSDFEGAALRLESLADHNLEDIFDKLV